MNKAHVFSLGGREFLTTQEGREYLLSVFQSNGKYSIIGTCDQLVECINLNPNSIIMFGEHGIPKHILKYLKKGDSNIEKLLKEKNCIIASFKKKKWFIERVYYRFEPKKEVV